MGADSEDFTDVKTEFTDVGAAFAAYFEEYVASIQSPCIRYSKFVWYAVAV